MSAFHQLAAAKLTETFTSNATSASTLRLNLILGHLKQALTPLMAYRKPVTGESSRIRKHPNSCSHRSCLDNLRIAVRSLRLPGRYGLRESREQVFNGAKAL